MTYLGDDRKINPKLSQFEGQTGSGAEALVGFGVHQDDIRPDAPDAAPGDHIVLPPARDP